MTTVENLKPTIWVLALYYMLWSRAIIQILSLRNSLWWRLHLINSVDNTKFPWNAPSMDGAHQFLQKPTLPCHPPSPGYSPHYPSFLHVMKHHFISYSLQRNILWQNVLFVYPPKPESDLFTVQNLLTSTLSPTRQSKIWYTPQSLKTSFDYMNEDEKEIQPTNILCSNIDSYCSLFQPCIDTFLSSAQTVSPHAKTCKFLNFLIVLKNQAPLCKPEVYCKNLFPCYSRKPSANSIKPWQY